MNRWTWALFWRPGLDDEPGCRRAYPARKGGTSAGSVVGLPPSTVTLWFSQRIEPAFSKIRVLGPTAFRSTKVIRRLTLPRRSRSVSRSQARPGTYRVQWRVLSLDSHVNEDHFTFEVRP
jgi:methionine-rich copper-binding protein CopC